MFEWKIAYDKFSKHNHLLSEFTFVYVSIRMGDLSWITLSMMGKLAANSQYKLWSFLVCMVCELYLDLWLCCVWVCVNGKPTAYTYNKRHLYITVEPLSLHFLPSQAISESLSTGESQFSLDCCSELLCHQFRLQFIMREKHTGFCDENGFVSKNWIHSGLDFLCRSLEWNCSD